MDWPKNEFCGMIPNSCLRVLRKQAWGNRTWEALLEAKYHFTIHHFTVSPLLCPWLVKCLVRAFSVASHLLLLFIHSPLLAVVDKSHTRLSSRLPRCCLCLIFDSSFCLLGLTLTAHLRQSVFPQNSLWMAYCFI